MLSLKLASSNLRKSFKTFAPFLLSTITMFVLLLVMAQMVFSPSIAKMPSGGAVSQVLVLGLVVLGLFSVFILIYSYRFLLLARAHEFGLYDVLGLRKGQIIAVAFWELVMTYLLTSIGGTLVGVAFAKFLFAVFVNVIGGNYFNLVISPVAVVLIASVFFLIFLLLFVIGSATIARSSGIDLMQAASKGEREPRGNLVLALLGLVFLGVGYGIALSVDNPISALTHFFFAVIAVIIGTYLFYISFTVWWLRFRKGRPSYYQPQNFVTLSSMLYRMKKNAAGLANITILLSMTVVTLVVTVGIFIGTGNTVRREFPREAMLSARTSMTREDLATQAKAASEKSGVAIHQLAVYQSADVNLVRGNQKGQDMIFSRPSAKDALSGSSLLTLELTTRQDLVSLGNTMTPLQSGDVAVYDSSGHTTSLSSFDWFGQKLNVAQHLSSLKNFGEDSSAVGTMLIVFSDDAALQRAIRTYPDAAVSGVVMRPTAIFKMPAQGAEKFQRAVNDANFLFATRTQTLKSVRALIGGFLFIGFVLGISFILGAALIIYYKQLAEGREDARSYRILQEVGLSRQEVAATIKSQVRMIFFLPLVVALVHFAAASLMVSKMIGLFGVNDNRLILLVSLSVVAAVAVIYWAIYKLTSRIYYRVVAR